MATKHKSAPRLGRGLNSLISNSRPSDPEQGHYQSDVLDTQNVAEDNKTPAATGQTAMVEVPIDDITTNPFQPRKDFKQEELAELANSITSQGIIQPLVVARSQDPSAENPYVLIAGERRHRAAKMAGLQSVPCIVRRATRQQMLEWALIENIHRSDLNPIERAQAYQSYMDRFSLTQAQVAQRLDQARPTVANYLRLLELEKAVRQFLLDGLLTFGHAKILAGLSNNPRRQLALAKRVVAGKLSVRQLERLAGSDAQSDPQPGEVPATAKTKAGKPAYIRDLEGQLTRTIGTRVTIQPGKTNQDGRIIVEYYSLDDFDRIASALGLQVQS